MAAEDFFAALGEFGVQLGMTLLSNASQPRRVVDKTVLANAVFGSSLDKAVLIVKHLNLIRYLNDEEGDFGFIVGVISQEMVGVIEAMTDIKISVFTDCTRDCEQACGRAVMALRKQGAS